MTQTVKNLPAMWETRFRSLVWEDPPGEGNGYPLRYSWGFPGGSDSKELSAMQENQVPSLGQEDPVEKGMAAQSSILAWRIPWTEVPGRLQCLVSQRVRHN